MLDKRAQVGVTMTWVIATIIIVVILSVSIYIAGASDLAKKMIGLKKEFELKGESDLLVTKSFAGYLRSDGVWDEIKDEKGYPDNPGFRFEKSSVDLANKIFPVFYSQGVRGVKYWMGIVSEKNLFGKSTTVLNQDFKTRFEVPSGKSSKSQVIYSNIKLNNDNHFELIINKENEK